MADELPEKVRDAITSGPLQPFDWSHEEARAEYPRDFAERIARLAIEESTRSLRERLERAQGNVKDIRKWPGDAMADYEGVERFSAAMLDKLAKKRGEGRGGWNREPEHEGCSLEALRQMFREHLKKGDMVDIANFAMMIWNRENPEGKHALAIREAKEAKNV